VESVAAGPQDLGARRQAKTLDEMVELRRKFLIEYQDEAYA